MEYKAANEEKTGVVVNTCYGPTENNQTNLPLVLSNVVSMSLW
jgi:hypothetical protein